MTSKTIRPGLRAAIIAAAILVIGSATALAAVALRKPQEVARNIGEYALSDAFAGDGAISIDETRSAGGYAFTLLGVVSGEGLREQPYGASANPARTYAVVAIRKADGGPMPSEPIDPPLYVTPLVKGQRPWIVNAHTLNGGYVETQVWDGVLYRLVECDSVEMFADRGVYLGICEAYGACSNADFAFDEATGEIKPSSSVDVSVLFDLPLDPAKADPAKADALLRELAP